MALNRGLMAARRLRRLRWGRALGAATMAGLLVAALGAIQYGLLRDSLIRAQVNSLRADLTDGRADFERIPRLRSQAARLQLCGPGGTPPATVNAALQLSSAVGLVAGRGVTVVVYNRQLLPVLSAEAPPPGSATRRAPRLSSEGLRRALGGQESAPEVVDNSAPELVVAFPVQFESERPCAVAQLSTSTRPIDDALGGERRRLAVGGAVVVALAYVAALAGTVISRAPPRRA